VDSNPPNTVFLYRSNYRDFLCPGKPVTKVRKASVYSRKFSRGVGSPALRNAGPRLMPAQLYRPEDPPRLEFILSHIARSAYISKRDHDCQKAACTRPCPWKCPARRNRNGILHLREKAAGHAALRVRWGIRGGCHGSRALRLSFHLVVAGNPACYADSDIQEAANPPHTRGTTWAGLTA